MQTKMERLGDVRTRAMAFLMALMAAMAVAVAVGTSEAKAAPVCAPTGANEICVAAGYPCAGGGVCVYGYNEWIAARQQELENAGNCTVNEIITLRCDP